MKLKFLVMNKILKPKNIDFIKNEIRKQRKEANKGR